MWLDMNQNTPRFCYLHFVKNGGLNDTLTINQLHVANNIYYNVHEESYMVNKNSWNVTCNLTNRIYNNIHNSHFTSEDVQDKQKL